MRVTTRRIAAVGVCAAATLMAAAALAWACTPEQYISTVRPLSGPAASEVSISGEGALPGAVVDILWNGLEGAKIAQTTADSAGKFSVKATVPATTPDVYSIIASAPGAGVGRSVFEVTSEPLARSQAGSTTNMPGPQTVNSDLWEGLPRSGSSVNSLGAPATPAVNESSRIAGLASMALGIMALLAALALPLVRNLRVRAERT